jgi:hypothetical protein
MNWTKPIRESIPQIGLGVLVLLVTTESETLSFQSGGDPPSSLPENE